MTNPYRVAGVASDRPLPPDTLRYRVHGDRELASFVAVGERCAADVLVALSAVGDNLRSSQSVLDFGCGCGRVAVWLNKHISEDARFVGVDVDRELVEWCQRNLAFGTFREISPLPPLPFGEGSFDLVLAISVFTHLDEARQMSWLAELHRILGVGKLLVASFDNGERTESLDTRERRRLDEYGYVFGHTEAWRGIFPDWYGSAFHSRPYVERTFGGPFEIVAYLKRGLNDDHDLVVLRRRRREQAGGRTGR